MEFSEIMTSKAMQCLKPHYLKILLVNLKTRIFKPIIVADDEWTALQKENIQIVDQYWLWFSKFIHTDDVNKFLSFGKNCKTDDYVVYRRKSADGYRYVIMEMMPTVAKDECVLYVRDIHDIYAFEQEFVVEQIGFVDKTTNMFNRVAYEKDIQNYTGGNVGAIFCDINALKYTNDHYGHDKGNQLILRFAQIILDNFKKYKCYHLSGDEFLIISWNTDIPKFILEARKFHDKINAMEVPIASVGYSVDTVLGNVVNDADADMYRDKKRFYDRFPNLKRA